MCQCYDGASVMSGECAGVQAKIREIAPQETSIAQDFFAVLEALYVCLSHSKANALFMEIQKTQRMGMQPCQLK